MPRPNNGPRLQLNSRGVYEIRWTEDGRTRRVSTRTSDQAEANRIFAGWLDEAEKEVKDAERIAVGDCLIRYRQDHLDTGRASAVDRQQYALAWLDQHFGGSWVDDIDDRDVERYRRARLAGRLSRDGRGVTDSTIRRELNTLRAALNHCRKQRLLAADDVPHIPLPDDGAPRDFYLTQAEAAQLIEVAERLSEQNGRMTRAHRFVVLGLATAARKTAIQELPWSLVDFEARQIRYDQLEARQTKKRKVAVPIASWAVPALEQAWREATGELVLDNAGNVRKSFANLARYAAEQTGNQRFRQLTPHALRHTAATHMAQAGVPLWQLAGVLGDTMATVERTYAHHEPDHLRSAVDSVSY